MSDFSIRSIITSSWKNIQGTKWPIWGVLLVAGLIGIGLHQAKAWGSALMGIPLSFLHTPAEHMIIYFAVLLLFQLVSIFLITPLTTGAKMVALKKHRGEAISASTGFKYWHKWFPLGVTMVYFSIGLMAIYAIFGFSYGFYARLVTGEAAQVWGLVLLAILFVIAFILYNTFFLFNLLFIADKAKGPFTALLCSAKTIAPHWRKVFLFTCFLVLVFILALLPFVLALLCPINWVKTLGIIVSVVLMIWAIPFTQLLLATAYDKLTTTNKP